MEEEKKESTKNEIMEWIKSIALAIIVAILIKTFIFNTTYVLGSSMHPTLNEKDRLFTNKLTLYFSKPDQGDIVILKAPDNPNKDYIKRVIGLPGDTVEIIDGKVYLNGEMLDENYLEEGAYTHTYDDSQWIVPEDQLFVLGDNREIGRASCRERV